MFWFFENNSELSNSYPSNYHHLSIQYTNQEHDNWVLYLLLKFQFIYQSWDLKIPNSIILKFYVHQL